MSERVHCCVPDCRRSCVRRREPEPNGYEIMCGRCWRTTDPRLRARYKQLRRRWRRMVLLSRQKAIRSKRRGHGFLMIEVLFDRAMARNWAAIREDAVIKSALRVEGTAGALAAKRRMGAPTKDVFAAGRARLASVKNG